MSELGVRKTVYLSVEADERAKQIGNFSAWVNKKLLESEGIVERPSFKEKWCVTCKTWNNTHSDFCEMCSTKLIKMERKARL